MAVSQKSWFWVKLNPMPGSFTAIALTMNQVAKEMINASVVIVRVRHAMRLPPSRQKAGSSGVHFSIQVAMVKGLSGFRSRCESVLVSVGRSAQHAVHDRVHPPKA